MSRTGGLQNRNARFDSSGPPLTVRPPAQRVAPTPPRRPTRSQRRQLRGPAAQVARHAAVPCSDTSLRRLRDMKFVPITARSSDDGSTVEHLDAVRLELADLCSSRRRALPRSAPISAPRARRRRPARPRTSGSGRPPRRCPRGAGDRGSTSSTARRRLAAPADGHRVVEGRDRAEAATASATRPAARCPSRSTRGARCGSRRTTRRRSGHASPTNSVDQTADETVEIVPRGSQPPMTAAGACSNGLRRVDSAMRHEPGPNGGGRPAAGTGPRSRAPAGRASSSAAAPSRSEKPSQRPPRRVRAHVRRGPARGGERADDRPGRGPDDDVGTGGGKAGLGLSASKGPDQPGRSDHTACTRDQSNAHWRAAYPADMRPNLDTRE